MRDPRRPSVTIHFAQSLDGRIATHTGDSQWIGGPASLRLAHQLRAEHDAVLVGVGTVLADNPRLTVRHVPGRSPLRVVVDSRLRLPPDCHLLNDGAAPTLVATTGLAAPDRRRALLARGADLLVLDPDGDGRVDLARLAGCLAERGVRSLLVEGGGGVITALLRQRLADRLVVCIAACVIGSGVQAVGDLGIARLRDALAFEAAGFRVLDGDVIFDGRLRPAPAAAAARA